MVMQSMSSGEMSSSRRIKTQVKLLETDGTYTKICQRAFIFSMFKYLGAPPISQKFTSPTNISSKKGMQINFRVTMCIGDSNQSCT